MSTVIRVDSEVYRVLQDLAEPFVDTPNSVLRRLLALDHHASEATKSAAFSKNRGRHPSEVTARGEDMAAPSSTEAPTEVRFSINSKDVRATAIRVGARGMRVLSAETPLREKDSLSESNRTVRRRLLSGGYFEEVRPGIMQLKRPFDFSSPSAASSVLFGYESNGRSDWKDEVGSSLGTR